MSAVQKAFALGVLVSLLPAYAYVAHMQNVGRFDDIGMLYRWYCAVAFAIGAGVVAAAVVAVVRRIRGRRTP